MAKKENEVVSTPKKKETEKEAATASKQNAEATDQGENKLTEQEQAKQIEQEQRSGPRPGPVESDRERQQAGKI